MELNNNDICKISLCTCSAKLTKRPYYFESNFMRGTKITYLRPYTQDVEFYQFNIQINNSCSNVYKMQLQYGYNLLITHKKRNLFRKNEKYIVTLKCQNNDIFSDEIIINCNAKEKAEEIKSMLSGLIDEINELEQKKEVMQNEQR